jgi:hypothetical protein
VSSTQNKRVIKLHMNIRSSNKQSSLWKRKRKQETKAHLLKTASLLFLFFVWQTEAVELKTYPDPSLGMPLGTGWRFGCYVVAMHIFFGFEGGSSEVEQSVTHSTKTLFFHCFQSDLSIFYMWFCQVRLYISEIIVYNCVSLLILLIIADY